MYLYIKKFHTFYFLLKHHIQSSFNYTQTAFRRDKS